MNDDAPCQRTTRWPKACRHALAGAGVAAALITFASASRAAAAGGGGGANASASLVAPSGANADPNGGYADFDRSMLSGGGRNTTDLSRFEHGNPVLAGNYNTDIYLNNVWVGRSDVRFVAASGKANATPCVDRKLLDQLGLHPTDLSAASLAQLNAPDACIAIGSLVPGATMTFDMSQLRLDTSVPQAQLGQKARGYVGPEYWDAGVPAALLNYNFNSYHASNQGQSQTSSYLGLNAGVNVGLWHLRENATVTWQSATTGSPARLQWQSIDTYAQRDLPSLRALLTIGDSYTDGAVFDSYGIRGVQLATDDRMLPQSLQGYAPVVRGVAQTNAKVTVRQNGVQIYQTTVAPGPFTVADLYPTGYGGNLIVSVTEADGRVNTFTVPYASVAQLLRPGVTRFSLVAGELRDTSIHDKPAVVQATMQHGFNNLLTGYAGVVGSQGYAAALIGAAVDTRYGALAVDITQANAQIPGYATQSGHSFRVTYSKIIPSTQTTFSVAAYRYSTGGYLSLAQAAQAREYAHEGINAFSDVPQPTLPTIDGVPEQSVLSLAQQATLNANGLSANSVVSATGIERQRNNFTLSLSQSLGQKGGSLYTNVSASDYWNRSGNDTQFQLGYNNHVRKLSYGISATRSIDPLGRYGNQYFVNFSVPLGSSGHAPTFALNLAHDETGGSQDQATVNGSFGHDSQYSYGATATHTSASGENAESVNGGYRSPYAVFNASYGSGSGYSQASVSVSGAAVAHAGGVTFGQPTGDTIGIVYVPGAAGAALNSGAGARVDQAGYALVSDLSPYSLNTIQIDPKGLPLDVQLDATSAQVAPYAGAVVLLKFKTENGRAIIVHAVFRNGQAVPFGAEVFNEKNVSLGVVGQAGQILARGVDASGKLSVRWQGDDGQAQSCSFPFQLTPRAKGKLTRSYEEIQATCVQPGRAGSGMPGTRSKI